MAEAVQNNRKATGGATGKGWKPGQSGNPGGRPKSKLTAVLAQRVDAGELADRLYALALSGDMQAIKYIYDRIEGTPTQRIEFSPEDFMEKLRAERPDLDDDNIRYISEQARKYAEGAV